VCFEHSHTYQDGHYKKGGFDGDDNYIGQLSYNICLELSVPLTTRSTRSYTNSKRWRIYFKTMNFKGYQKRELNNE